MEKLNSISSSRTTTADASSQFTLPIFNTNMNETFDKYELRGGGEKFDPLVTAEALPGSTWMDSQVFPLVYELYGSVPGITLNRNTETLGLVPLKAMSIINRNQADYLLSGRKHKLL